MKSSMFLLLMVVTATVAHAQSVILSYKQGGIQELQNARCSPFLDASGAPPQHVSARQPSECFLYQDKQCQTPVKNQSFVYLNPGSTPVQPFIGNGNTAPVALVCYPAY